MLVVVGIDDSNVTPPTRRPPSSIVARHQHAGLVALASEAGWHPITAEALPATPVALGPRCLLRVVDADTDPSTVIRLALRGVAVVLIVDSTDQEEVPSARLLGGLARSSRPVLANDQSCLTLTPLQVGLACALGGGATIPAAARRHHVSERSAHRHLTAARRTVGVATTGQLGDLVMEARRPWMP